jgi:hypothetical protein
VVFHDWEEQKRRITAAAGAATNDAIVVLIVIVVALLRKTIVIGRAITMTATAHLVFSLPFFVWRLDLFLVAATHSTHEGGGA